MNFASKNAPPPLEARYDSCGLRRAAPRIALARLPAYLIHRYIRLALGLRPAGAAACLDMTNWEWQELTRPLDRDLAFNHIAGLRRTRKFCVQNVIARPPRRGTAEEQQRQQQAQTIFHYLRVPRAAPGACSRCAMRRGNKKWRRRCCRGMRSGCQWRSANAHKKTPLDRDDPGVLLLCPTKNSYHIASYSSLF
jgi:hypothetical protein